MLGNIILRNSSYKNVGVLRGDFWGFGCPNDALLAKTMSLKVAPPWSQWLGCFFNGLGK